MEIKNRRGRPSLFNSYQSLRRAVKVGKAQEAVSRVLEAGQLSQEETDKVLSLATPEEQCAELARIYGRWERARKAEPTTSETDDVTDFGQQFAV